MTFAISRRSGAEPTFIFTVPDHLQVWTVDNYRHYLALEYGWGFPEMPAFNLGVIMPGEVVTRSFVYSTGLTDEMAAQQGITFRKARINIHPVPLDMWEDPVPPPYTFDTWLPEDNGGVPGPSYRSGYMGLLHGVILPSDT